MTEDVGVGYILASRADKDVTAFAQRDKEQRRTTAMASKGQVTAEHLHREISLIGLARLSPPGLFWNQIRHSVATDVSC